MNIDFKKVFLLLLPIKLRSAWLLITFFDSLGTILGTYWTAFIAWFGVKKYQISITPQVCRLEAVLNDTFDPVNRGIYIDEPVRIPTQYFYRKTDLKDWYLDDGKFIINDTRYGYLYDFAVNVPSAVVFDLERMKGLVSQYKLIGKIFKIKVI